GMRGLFLHAQHLAVGVELDDAEPLGVLDVVAKDGAAAIVLGVVDRVLQNAGEAVAIEDIVAQNHRAAVAADELLAQDERLGQAVGGRLDFILQVDAVLAAVPQQVLEAGGVLRRRDDEDILDAGQHQGGQRIIDHGLVVDRQQLFAGDHGQRVKPGAGAAGENNAFHYVHSFVSDKGCAAPRQPARQRRRLPDHKAEAASAVNNAKGPPPPEPWGRQTGLFLFYTAGNEKSTVTALSELEPPLFEVRSEEHTSELQSRFDLVCRLLLEKKKQAIKLNIVTIDMSGKMQQKKDYINGYHQKTI